MNKGARKLAKAPGTQQEKAARVGVTQQTISSWESGDVIPLGVNLVKCKQEFRIQLNDWLTPDDDRPSVGAK